MYPNWDNGAMFCRNLMQPNVLTKLIGRISVVTGSFLPCNHQSRVFKY